MDSSEEASDNRTNLIINYLPQGLTEHELYKLFIVVGPVKSCRIMKDLKTGYSYGFGFVEYEKPEDARKAITQLNNLNLQHKKIKVSFARPAGEDIKDTNLYVQNLPRCYSEDQLEQLFSAYGNIVQRNLLKDKVTGLPKGVAFVRYDKKSEADAAIANMNGVIPEGGSERLVVRIAEEHGKMRSQYRPMMGPGPGPGGYGRGNFNNTGGKMLGGMGGRLGKRFNPMGGGGGMGSYSGMSQNYYGFSNFSSDY